MHRRLNAALTLQRHVPGGQQAHGNLEMPHIPCAQRLTSARRVDMQLDIERKLRGLLTKDKQKAEEEAALAIGLCRSVP